MMNAAEQEELLKAAMGLSAGEFPMRAVKYNPKHFEAEQDRDQQRVRSCNMVDTAPEPRFDAIKKLMSEVFEVPVALITLNTDDRIWFKDRIGPFGENSDRDGSWCNYMVVPTAPEVLITEDASKDARFSHNPYVAGAPYIKFYAGAPLVGTDGRRYGALCVCDTKERSFTAEVYHLLIDFAELAAQEIERDSSMLEEWKAQAQHDVDSNRKLRACLSTATDGVGLVDVRAAHWKFKYANEAFARTFNETVADHVGQGLWDKFEPLRLTPFEIAQQIANGASIAVIAIHKVTGQKVILNLQAASSDHIFPGEPVGAPSLVPSEMVQGRLFMGLNMEKVKELEMMCSNIAKCFYFVVISPYTSSPEASSSDASSRRMSLDSATTEVCGSELVSRSSMSTSGMYPHPNWRPISTFGSSYGDYDIPEGLAGLELGPLIGSGSFGKVYRGVYDDMVVAVKVSKSSTSEETIEAAEEESAISLEVNHPNLVKTVRCTSWKTALQVTTDDENLKKEETMAMWILQEFCDRGTLIDGVERGWLSEFHSIMSRPNMAYIYMTLKEIADGMAYLHSKDILHCDLNGRNVMLKFSPKDKRMFTAKICDFGLAHMCTAGEITANMVGTITHMSPEHMVGGKITFASDVWAFGVLMWEMFTGQRAYQGKHVGNIIYMVTYGGKGRIRIPADAPEVYQEIFNMCQQINPEDRPSFDEISSMVASALAQEEHKLAEC